MRSHGTLAKWNDARGFGFIVPAQGTDEVFVHVSAFPPGTRPLVGEMLSFEIVTDDRQRKRAVSLQRPGSAQPRPMSRAARSRWPARAALAAGIAGAAFLYWGAERGPDRSAFESFQEVRSGSSPEVGALPRPRPAVVAEDPTPRFACDGRAHCSQMTSCVEATWFLRHCPGVKMDGDHDGVPCEDQWCGNR